MSKLGKIVYNTILTGSILGASYCMWNLPSRQNYPLVEQVSRLEYSKKEIILQKENLDSQLEKFYDSEVFKDLNGDVKNKITQETNIPNLDFIIKELNEEIGKMDSTSEYNKQNSEFTYLSAYYMNGLFVYGLIAGLCIIGRGMFNRIKEVEELSAKNREEYRNKIKALENSV